MLDLVGNPEDWFSHDEAPLVSSTTFKTCVAEIDCNDDDFVATHVCYMLCNLSVIKKLKVEMSSISVEIKF